MKYKKILVLAPHTDDAELGCGGTIARFKEEGAQVVVAVFSTAEESLPAGAHKDTLEIEFIESMKTMQILGNNVKVLKYPVRKLSYYRQEILEDMVAIKKEFLPDLVFIPSSKDVHQDHQVIQSEGLRAFKDASVVGYELPWNQIDFSSQFFVKLERKHIEKKWNSLLQYKTQIELGRSYFTEEFIFGLSKVRGTQVKCDYAEAFEVFRISI